VIGVTILAVMARWVGNRTVQVGRQDPITAFSWECLYAIGVALLLVLTLQLKGIIPIQ